MIERMLKIGRTTSKLVRFFVLSYLKHWFAVPAGAIAAVVSTVGAASAMILISKFYSGWLTQPYIVITNGVVAPLLAYVAYLSIYYFLMFVIERKDLYNETGKIDREKLKNWLVIVKYDYLAHVPSDIYLISLASIMQMGLQFKGMEVFYAVLISQFVDDFITFLKEPAIWSGAKHIAQWEGSSQTTLLREAKKFITSSRGS